MACGCMVASLDESSVEFDDNNVVVDAKLIKEEVSCDDENVFTLVRLYHQHKSSPKFQ